MIDKNRYLQIYWKVAQREEQFQKKRCFRRLQVECYFLPITFADLFSPAAHISKLHESRHNFLPLTIPPPSHPAPP